MSIFASRHIRTTQRVIARTIGHGVRDPRYLAVASSILIIAAQYLPGCWWLVFVALIPFMHAVRITRSRAGVFWVGALFGAALLGSATFATLSAGMGSTPYTFGPITEHALVVASWLLFFVPLVPTVIAFSFILQSVRSVNGVAIVGLTAAWVLLEYARMFLFNMATFAPDVGNPPFFSAGFLGYPLADNESFLQLAALGGVSLMSAVAVAINACLYRCMLAPRRFRRLGIAGIAGIVLVFSSSPLVSWRVAVDAERAMPPVTVGIMALYAKDTSAYDAETVDAVTKLAAESPDLIVLPEGASYFTSYSGEHGEQVASTTVLGTRRSAIGGFRASVAERGTVDGRALETVRGKSILAAQGEYVVGLFSWAARSVGLSDHLSLFPVGGNLSAMSWGKGIAIGEDGIRVSAALCVEVLEPWLGARLVKREETHMLAFMLSHGHFNGAYTLRVDTLRFLKVRAVEAQVPLVASAYAAPAYALDRYGRISAVLGAEGVSEWGVTRVTTLSPGSVGDTRE